MPKRREILAHGLALVAATSLLGAPAVTVLRAAPLFDGTSDSTIADAVVLLQGSRITAKGLTLAIPTGAQNRRDARIGEAERSSRF